MNAEKMVKCFPDYGKAPHEYLSSITLIMAEYAAHIQERICDLKFGLPSRLKFLPTVSDVVEAGNQALQAEREIMDYDRRFAGRPISRGDRAPFRPFPQLWAEFGNDFMDDKVRAGMSFDTLDGACRALVREGRDAALNILTEALAARKIAA